MLQIKSGWDGQGLKKDLHTTGGLLSEEKTVTGQLYHRKNLSPPFLVRFGVFAHQKRQKKRDKIIPAI